MDTPKQLKTIEVRGGLYFIDPRLKELRQIVTLERIALDDLTEAEMDRVLDIVPPTEFSF